MKQLTNKEYEAYEQYKTDKLHGRILTPDGLRIVCAGSDNDPRDSDRHLVAPPFLNEKHTFKDASDFRFDMKNMRLAGCRPYPCHQ